MNQRDAWIGCSSEGVPNWAEDTTGIGPTTSSGLPETSPDSNVVRIARSSSRDGSMRGGAAPKVGHWATTTLTRGSQAATRNTSPAENEAPPLPIRFGSWSGIFDAQGT